MTFINCCKHMIIPKFQYRSATVADDALLLQALAAVLELLTFITIHGANLGISLTNASNRANQPHIGGGTHVVIGLVSHRPAASQSLGSQQVALSAVHADAIIWLQVPAARALFAGNGAPEETKREEQGEASHFVWGIRAVE